MIEEIKIRAKSGKMFLFLSKGKISLKDENQVEKISKSASAHIQPQELLEAMEKLEESFKENRTTDGFSLPLLANGDGFEEIIFRVCNLDTDTKEVELFINQKSSKDKREEFEKEKFTFKEVKNSLLLLFPSPFE